MKEKDSTLQPIEKRIENAAPEVVPFVNKLAQDQEDSFLNKTFTIDTTRRRKEFSFKESMRGFLPRARSTGPRRSLKHVDDIRRARSETTSMFAADCKLPSIDKSTTEKKTCTMRPWSRTQEELRKYKQALIT